MRTCRMQMEKRKVLHLVWRYSSSNAQKTKIPKRKGEYLFGLSPSLAALQARRRKVHAVFLKEGAGDNRSRIRKSALAEVKKCAQRWTVDIHSVDKRVLERLSGNRPHQGIVLDAEPLNFKQLDPKAHKIGAKTSEKLIWLALDEIQDPMNLGAILRCAFFLGVDKVIATASNCCRLSPVVSKASSGAMELMPVYTVRNMANFLKEAAENGWQVVGTCGSSATDQPVVSCYDYHLQGPTILVLGNEGHGLRGPVQECCTTLLTIAPLRALPQGFDSLNVAVATGIVLHSLQRKHVPTHKD